MLFGASRDSKPIKINKTRYNLDLTHDEEFGPQVANMKRTNSGVRTMILQIPLPDFHVLLSLSLILQHMYTNPASLIAIRLHVFLAEVLLFGRPGWGAQTPLTPPPWPLPEGIGPCDGLLVKLQLSGYYFETRDRSDSRSPLAN